MSKKLNCWEFVNCGREKNGLMVPIMGECKVVSDMKYDGLNKGLGAGRACWMTYKNDCVMKKSQKLSSCYDCPFYKRVAFEEEEEIVYEIEPIAV